MHIQQNISDHIYVIDLGHVFISKQPACFMAMPDNHGMIYRYEAFTFFSIIYFPSYQHIKILTLLQEANTYFCMILILLVCFAHSCQAATSLCLWGVTFSGRAKFIFFKSSKTINFFLYCSEIIFCEVMFYIFWMIVFSIVSQLHHIST